LHAKAEFENERDVIGMIAQNWHIWTIGFILMGITVGAIWRFILPAIRLDSELKNVIVRLKEVKYRNRNSAVTDLDQIGGEIMEGEKLSHLWSEYTETLHAQKTIDQNSGQEKIACWRATSMAEAFFSEQVLVDTPLKTEFYKHLPGILTGLGIIGTFSGLIMGLSNFNVTDDANVVRASLATLIQGVGHAFLISALAIALAMLFTWLEKSMVTARYRQVEELCHLIDSLFDAGAGEEYLARLVKAAETSATQSLQIKDALVADLKQILSDITNQQVAAAANHNQQLSAVITQSFAESIREPIQRISAAVEHVGSNQGEAVNKLLTDVLASFTAQMRDMFGGQLQGMTDVLQFTTSSVNKVATQFDQISESLQQAGKGAADAMADRLNELIASLEARQQVMNQQMGEFVDQIRSLVRESQTESSQKMQEVLGELGEKVSGMVTQLDMQSRQAMEHHDARQNQFAQQTTATIGGLETHIQELCSSLKQASQQMGASVDTLAQTTKSSIDQLDSGAAVLNQAAAAFAKAGNGVTTTMQSASQATEKIQGVAVALSHATTGVQKVMEDYKGTRDTFATIVSELKSTVENARRDASLTTDLVESLSRAAQQLGAAKSEAENYLQGVSQVLVEAHSVFAKSIESTLHQGNAQFRHELSTAVGHLKSGIQDFSEALEGVRG
jgi:ABC-type transporter Mla subunit MlaD